MDERPKRKPMRLPQWDYSKTGYYFITICAGQRNKDVFCSLVGGGLRAAPPSQYPQPPATPVGGGLRAAPPEQSTPVGGGLRAAPPSQSTPVGGGLRAAPPDPGSPLSYVKLTPIGTIVDTAIRDIPKYNPGVEVDVYCIMPDHIHLIVTLSGRHGGRPLQSVIGRMKSYTQRQYQKSGSIWGPKLWQESYYDHIIRGDPDLQETRRYIQTNPLNTKEGVPL